MKNSIFDDLKFYNTANIDRCFVCYLQLLSHHKNIKPNNPQVKALFGKESCQRSWLRDWKIFCLYTIFGCKFGWKFGWKSDYHIKVNPSGFLTKNHLPLHVMPRGYKGGKIADFWACYLLPKFDVNRLQNNPSDGYAASSPCTVEPRCYWFYTNVIL